MKRHLMVLTAVLLVGTLAYATESPKTITFKNVVFDHEGHKGDCISCHGTRDGGNKIPDFGKEWAHKTCIGCHTAIGSGPTVCKECHKK